MYTGAHFPLQIIPLHPRHDSSDSIVTLCGRVQRIRSGDVEDIVLLQHFKVSTTLDERLRMPVLTCPDDDCVVAVSPKVFVMTILSPNANEP